MRTLTTRRTTPRDSTLATGIRRPGTAARVVLGLVGVTAILTTAMGVPALHSGPVAHARHAVVADDMGPTIRLSGPDGASSARA